MRLADKIAIVTGAGSGIGRATALRFALEGARLVVNDLDEAALADTVTELAGEDHCSITADVAEESTAEALVSAARAFWGRLDVIVSNAGLFHRSDLAELTVEEWDRLMAVNVRSMFLIAKHGIPLMLESGGGAIVTLSSISAYIGQEIDGETTVAYNSTKAAVRQLTTSLASRYAAEGIRVNSVAPGPVRTNIMRRFHHGMTESEDEAHWAAIADDATPMGRYAAPGEVASAILFLASDEASFITGATLPVDGGFLAR